MLCFLLFGRKKKERKEKRNHQGAFFPGQETRYALLTVPCRIFEAVMCNESLI
jgi:hypothetical protein